LRWLDRNLFKIAETIGPLGKATEVLDVARRYRNSWKGHGGYMKPSDAERLHNELQQPIRDFYEITSSLFRRFQLVRPGKAEGTDTGLKFEIEKLSGSDPTFEKEQVELDRLATRAHPACWQGFAADWSSDQRAFKNVPWGSWLISGRFGLCTWLELLSRIFRDCPVCHI
jgi:hypothetical protein